MRKYKAAEMGKSGTPSQTPDKWASTEELWFFLGHLVKNRDCPGKPWMDGHFMYTLVQVCDGDWRNYPRRH